MDVAVARIASMSSRVRSAEGMSGGSPSVTAGDIDDVLDPIVAR